MHTLDIDFEGTGTQAQTTAPAQTTSNGGEPTTTQEDVTNLNGGGVDDVTGKDGNNQPANNQATEQPTTDENEESSTGQLNIGDSVEVDGIKYTVANNGNLVDEKGNVFKEAKDVQDWLKSVSVEEATEDGINISSIQEALGVTVTDENGQPVEFTNDAAGVKSYVDSVIQLKSNELQQAAVNRLYAENPLLKQFQDYVQLNGTPRGFGDIPDRSAIQLQQDNEAQQIAIIRMAAYEFGNKSLNDNYIKYLRDSGGLYDEAKEQLQALVEKDQAVRKDIETRAAQARAEEAASVEAYWKQVNDAVSKRTINGYRIPESFTKEVNGQKIVLTPNDFFNYLSKPIADENGNKTTGYQRDLNALTDEQYMQREILDAWLMFTGGTYKDLIDMAVKEDKVRQLRVKSQEQRANKSVRIVRNKPTKVGIDDILL